MKVEKMTNTNWNKQNWLKYDVFWGAESFYDVGFPIFQLVFKIWKEKVSDERFESFERTS